MVCATWTFGDVLRTGSMEHLSKSPTTISKISSNLGKIGPKKMLWGVVLPPRTLFSPGASFSQWTSTLLKLTEQAFFSLLTHILSSIVKIIGKQGLEQNFRVLWSVYLFYASFSQWLAETDFWKSARVYIYENYTFYQPWYAQQVSRLILLWSFNAGVKFSFGQWGDDHWLKLTSEFFFWFSNKTSAFFVSGNYAILMKCGVVTSVVNVNHPKGQKSHFSPWQSL